MPKYRIMARDVKNGTRIERQSLNGAVNENKAIAQDEADAFAEQQSKQTKRQWVGEISEITPRQ